MTSVTKALLERHSTRAFLDRPIAANLVREIIDVARRARGTVKKRVESRSDAVAVGVRLVCCRAFRLPVPK
jgi:nitroreductase